MEMSSAAVEATHVTQEGVHTVQVQVQVQVQVATVIASGFVAVEGGGN